MIPQEKAKELVEKYMNMDFDNPDSGLGGTYYNISKGDAIECALVTTREVINTLESAQYLKDKSNILELRRYWQSVLTELQNL